MWRCGALTTLLLLAACAPKTGAGRSRERRPVGGSADYVEIVLDQEAEALDEMMGSELLVATAACGDLLALERDALLGKLSDGVIRCLDRNVRHQELQTARDRFSRVLLADAWAKGDHHRWEGVARRHLNQISHADPDLCFKLARHLSQKGPEAMDEAMFWADKALENRSRWVGDTHTSRVNSLLKLKAVAAQKKWQWLEEQYVKRPSEDALLARDAARATTKTLAREWLEYARQADKDTTVALALCTSAAGTAAFCALD